MKKGYWRVAGLALVAAIVIAILLSCSSGAQENPATVVETVNQVDAHPRPKDDWEPAAVDMLIYGGGQVRTGAASSARLAFLEGTVRLSADSIFTVKSSVTRQEQLVSTLFLQEGRLWADLTTDQPHEFSVETGSAVAAVRDTRFSVRVAAGETLLSVAQGQATLTAQGQSVTVAEGQQAIVAPDQPPSPPEPMSDEERKLWATEGEMPELAPPPVEMWGDVSCTLEGPAGDPASRNPKTAFDVTVQDRRAAQVVVETPDGQTILVPPYGDIFGQERRFHRRIAGLPQAWGTYTFTALDADGAPLPGAVASDVYVGGREPDPPANVRAEMTDAGLLVTWDPSPAIPGAFDPSGAPVAGFYQITLVGEGVGMSYGWHHESRLPETSHLIPLRRQDFGQGDRGQALEELQDSLYYLTVTAFSRPPEGTAGRSNECASHDPAEEIQIRVEGGQVRVEGR